MLVSIHVVSETEYTPVPTFELLALLNLPYNRSLALLMLLGRLLKSNLR
jgi:hypothetical protein